MTSEVDRALASEPKGVVPALLAITEGQCYERKSARIRARDLAVPEVAMANAEGGWIIVGLHDGRAEGLSPDQINALRQAAIEFTSPPVRARAREIEAVYEGEAITLLAIQIEPGERVHETVGGECYLRVGDESRRLGFAQRQELEFDRGGAPFDGHPVSAILADVDTSLARAYRDLIGSSTVADMLAARGLTGRMGR